jgi:Bifunctional DNA primase/polymerase, N-terminal
MSALEAALQYIGRGWPILPCRDKVPLVRGGVHAATRDLARIERWWHTWPQANVAIACGAPSGVVVIDIDWPAEVTELLNLTTLCASTPSGGRHLYCRYVEGIRNRAFDWGEVRSTGLYVVAPPGPGREWINNSVIADVPEHLAKIIHGTPTVTSLPSGSWADAIADHRKTVARWSREESFALVAYRNATNRVLNAKHRMIALNAETYSLGRLVGRGWITQSDVVRGMEAASRHNGLIAKRGLEVVRAVILGALAKGAARPYPDLTSREVTVGDVAMALPQNSSWR